jgi:hypothetical protein
MTQVILWNSYGYGSSDVNHGVTRFNIGDYSSVRPLGAHQLAFWLRQNGYSVVVIDFCNYISTTNLTYITESYITKDTIAVGVSTSFWQSRFEPSWVDPARSEIERKHPNIKWILGGAREVEYRQEWITFNSYAEDSVLSFLSENSSTIKFDIKKSIGQYTNLDFIQPHEVLSMELGRGCQFKCKFCAYPMIGKKKGTYVRNMHLVREELIKNYEEYGVTRYNFIDDTVNEDIEKVENLARLTQSLPFELEWVGYCRADLIWSRPTTIKTLRDSGLRSVFFGIESFHPVASKIIGKGWSGKHAKNFLLELKDRWCDQISISLGLIVGLPMEPLDSLDEHSDWLIQNKFGGRWAWTPLSISNKSKYTWKSEFEKNYQKYGIEFDKEESDDWYHDLSNKKTSIDKTNSLSKKGFQHMSNSGFSQSDYCTTTGSSYVESSKLTLPELFSSQIIQNIRNCLTENVSRYIRSHQSRTT